MSTATEPLTDDRSPATIAALIDRALLEFGWDITDGPEGLITPPKGHPCEYWAAEWATIETAGQTIRYPHWLARALETGWKPEPQGVEEAPDATRELARLQDLRENDPLRLMHIQDAIAESHLPADTREQQCTALEHVCHNWRERRQKDAKVAERANALGHAGLRYLVELDWLDAFKHGQSEALWLVEKLLRCTDDSEVDEAFEAWNEVTGNAEDTWILDERE